MQKVVKFLESYVQWIALSLGLLWVLWVGYAYWAQKPVAKIINGQSYGPAEVDEYITRNGGPVDALSNALKPDAKVPPDIRKLLPQSPPQYVDLLKDEMGLKGVVVKDVLAWSPAGGGKFEGPQKGPEENNKVTELPVLTPETIKMLGATAGLSVAYVPDPKAAVNAKDPQQKLLQPPGPATPPVADPNNPNAVVPPPPPPIVLVPREVSWVTVSANVIMKEIDNAFAKAKVPDVAAFSQFLRVQLVREEKMPDGSWGKQQVINDLPIEFKPAWKDKQPPAGDEGVYLDWSSKNVADIVEPPFYEVLRGDVWRTISMPDPAAGAPAVAVEFDPSTVTDPSKLTDPAERKKWQEWKFQQAKDKAAKEAEERKQKQPPKPTGPGPSRTVTPSGGMAPPNDQRVGGPADRNRFIDRSNRTGPTPRTTEGPNTTAVTPQNPGSAANPAAAADLPTGTFKPSDPAAKDVEVWAHDDTTLPGHVYRYKLVVYLKNPLFGTQGMAKNPDAAALVALKPAESEWSKEVTSPRKHYFFAASNGDALGGNTPRIKFEYFWWEDGDWKNKTLTLQPGDAVGNTPWTLYDIRPSSGNENRALLVSQTGAIESHTQKADLTSADYKRLKGLVKPSTAAAGSGG